MAREPGVQRARSRGTPASPSLLSPSPDRGGGAGLLLRGVRSLRGTRPRGGSQKERPGKSMLENTQSVLSPPSPIAAPAAAKTVSERGAEDAAPVAEAGSGRIERGASLPLRSILSSPSDKRLDRQRAQMWDVEGGGEQEAEDPCTLDMGDCESPGEHALFQRSEKRERFVPEIEDERMAYHLELLQDLPAIVARSKSDSVFSLREAAAHLRELSGSTLPVVRQMCQGGGIPRLLALLQHRDPAVVEPAVLAIVALAQEREAAKELADEGIMAALSTAFVRASEATPRPHTSIQGNVAAAYLALFSSLKTKRSTTMLTGPRVLKSLLLAAGPLSGTNYQGRRDAMRLLLLLSDRAEVRTQLVSLGAVEVLVSTADEEEADEGVLEEAAALLLLVAKSVEGVRKLCSPPQVEQQLQRMDLNGGTSEGGDQEPLEGGSGATPGDMGKGEGVAQALGVTALVRLLDPGHTPLTQEYAASALMRILTRGLADCSLVVRSNAELKPALETLLQKGSPKAKKKAEGLLDALSPKDAATPQSYVGTSATLQHLKQ